ncbi:Unconventional myosin-X (Unconventional myosin-10), partial [Durusdinium trenchii]
MILHVESKNNEAEASSGESSSCLRVFASLAKAKTVSSGFRSSLASLVQKLNEADPHFIRCVKPNPEKVPDKFASTLAMEQLTCSGVFEAVRIRQSGFAARVPFGDFLGRYKIVVPKAKLKAILSSSSEADRAKAFAEALPEALAPLGGCATGDLVLGKSKVFAKQPVMIRLDKARDMAVSTYAIDIQRVWRGYRTRKMLATCKVVFDQLKNWCAENDFYKTAG